MKWGVGFSIVQKLGVSILIKKTQTVYSNLISFFIKKTQTFTKIRDPCQLAITAKSINKTIIDYRCTGLSSNTTRIFDMRRTDSGEPPVKRSGASTSDTGHPDLPLMTAMAARRARGLPPLQPLIRTMNQTGTLCYAGAGVNTILCAPKITEFLGRLPRSFSGLPNMMRLLALRQPGLVGL